MTTTPATNTVSAPARRRAGARSSLAVIALACAIIPFGTVAASLVWVYRSERAAAVDRQRDQMGHAAGTIAISAEPLLTERNLSPLRMMVGDAARRAGADECAIVLADGAIIAHSDPSRVTAKELPAAWPKAKAGDSTLAEPAPGMIESRATIELPDAAQATVLLRARPAATLAADTGFVIGLAIIAAIAIGGSLVVARQSMVLLRPLRAIQGSMQSLAAGESSLEALAISPRWGAEAAAWNAFLAVRQADRTADLDRQVGEAGAPGRTGEGLVDRACDALPQGLLVLDATGRVRYVNGAAGALIGLQRTDLIGKPLAGLIDDQRLASTVRAVAEEGLRRRGSVEIKRGEGDETSVLRLTCCRAGAAGDASSPSIVLVEDLTQQRVADLARDTFVTHATHELRTPLTNIRLYLETLLEGGDKDAKTRGECINVINQEARRLERMVGDMLSVAEIEAGSLKLHTDDVRLDALFDELKADYQAQSAEKHIALAFDLPPKLPVIRGDRDKIAMSLHNLLGNAFKYTPQGGTVTVSVEETPTTLAVRVTDTGIGIAPEEAERIFEKFYRSKDRRIAKITGTGLGLSIAREVVRLHGGDITVDSRLDQGSTFTLTLPHLAQAA